MSAPAMRRGAKHLSPLAARKAVTLGHATNVLRLTVGNAVAHTLRVMPMDHLLPVIMHVPFGTSRARKEAGLQFNSGALRDAYMLGRPYVVVRIGMPELDALWQRNRALYVAPSEANAGSMAYYGRQSGLGVFVSPPVVAGLNGGIIFLDGVSKFVYQRSVNASHIMVAATSTAVDPLTSSGAQIIDDGSMRATSLAPQTLDDAISKASRTFAAALGDGIIALYKHIAGSESASIAAHLKKSLRKDDASDGADGSGEGDAEVTVDFDAPNQNAVDTLTLQLLSRIREISDQQRAAILSALQSGTAAGQNPIAMARAFRGSIGLTDYQMQFVNSYRAALQSIGTQDQNPGSVLDRELRDKRYDSTINRAISASRPLTSDQIDAMVQRYTDSFVAYRADVIARTEALRAVHEAEHAVWKAAIDSGDIDPDSILQTWVTAHDDRVRDSHAEMDGQTQPWDTAFISGLGNKLMYPGDGSAPAEDVINCRCVVTRQIQASTGQTAGDQPNDAGSSATVTSETDDVPNDESDT